MPSFKKDLWIENEGVIEGLDQDQLENFLVGFRVDKFDKYKCSFLYQPRFIPFRRDKTKKLRDEARNEREMFGTD